MRFHHRFSRDVFRHVNRGVPGLSRVRFMFRACPSPASIATRMDGTRDGERSPMACPSGPGACLGASRAAWRSSFPEGTVEYRSRRLATPLFKAPSPARMPSDAGVRKRPYLPRGDAADSPIPRKFRTGRDVMDTAGSGGAMSLPADKVSKKRHRSAHPDPSRTGCPVARPYRRSQDAPGGPDLAAVSSRITFSAP